MIEDYLDIKIDVFDNVGQHAKVRRSLPMLTFIQEVLREFDEIAGPAELYALYTAGSETPLDRNKSVTELDIQPWDHLVFDYINKNLRRNLQPAERFALREQKSGHRYEITYQPALIGRPTNAPDHDLCLAVNLQPLPYGETISRSHAQITYRDGKPYLECLAEKNPVYLNGQILPFSRSRILRANDRIEIGRSRITLIVEIDAEAPAPDEMINQQSPSATEANESGFVAEIDTETSVTTMDSSFEFSQPPSTAPRVSQSQPVAGRVDVPKAKLVYLQVVPLGLMGRSVALEAFPFGIGRTTLNLGTESGVSRNHAKIDFDPARREFNLTDLMSTNGVMINQMVIQPGIPYPLPNHAEISLGKLIKIRFDY